MRSLAEETKGLWGMERYWRNGKIISVDINHLFIKCNFKKASDYRTSSRPYSDLTPSRSAAHFIPPLLLFPRALAIIFTGFPRLSSKELSARCPPVSPKFSWLLFFSCVCFCSSHQFFPSESLFPPEIILIVPASHSFSSTPSLIFGSTSRYTWRWKFWS